MDKNKKLKDYFINYIMEFYKIYKSCIINSKDKKCNTNNNYIKEKINNYNQKNNENNNICPLFKTNLGAVFK